MPDGTGEFWNRRWHEYTGLSPEAVRGWGWQDAIHPEDLKEITDKWLGFLASGEPGEVEGRLRRFDGVYRWFLFRAEPLRDESGNIVNWYGADTDIDDLKRAEAKLHQDEEEPPPEVWKRQPTISVMTTEAALAPREPVLRLCTTNHESYLNLSSALHSGASSRTRPQQ